VTSPISADFLTVGDCPGDETFTESTVDAPQITLDSALEGIRDASECSTYAVDDSFHLLDWEPGRRPTTDFFAPLAFKPAESESLSTHLEYLGSMAQQQIVRNNRIITPDK
jgi:hypothetical protein